MSYTSENWPIAAALHQFAHPGVQDLPADQWLADLTAVKQLGFDHVDLTDSWLQIADMTSDRLAELKLALVSAGLEVPALSITRRSIIDPVSGEENLAYTHRTIDAAAELGVGVLSLGLHRPLTAAQRQQLWFWTAPGECDPENDPETWNLTVMRFREIAAHAAERDMIVSLEMYEDTYLGSADSSVRLIHDIAENNVGLNPDIGNLVRLHRPIEDWRSMLEKTLPYTNYWQVKNYSRDEDPTTGVIMTQPTPLSTGIINYRDAVRDALALGFQGVFCCEHYGGDGIGVSAMNMRYLRTLLPQPAAERSNVSMVGEVQA